jgi:hypothetical protein
LIRDESGIWWFIGCRGFKINGNNGKPTLKYFLGEGMYFPDSDSENNQRKKTVETVKKDKSDYTKLKMCRFC